MEIRQLKYFIAVVDACSITRAAHQLHVVQSAISHQIANLEAELGAGLLLRSKAGVAPTEAGLLLYRHAQAALRNLETARQTINTASKDVRGVVVIGIPNGAAPMLALPLLHAARMQLPNVELNIFEGLSTLLAERLAAGKLDMAVLFDTTVRGFDGVPLFTEKLQFMSSNAAAVKAYAGRSEISLREVVQWPLLLAPSPNLIRDLLERECVRADLKLQVVANLNGVHTIREAVKSGLGSTVTVAANANFSARQKKVLMLQITDPEIERPAGLFQPGNSSLTQAGLSVKILLIQTVEQLISGNKWPKASLLSSNQKNF